MPGSTLKLGPDQSPEDQAATGTLELTADAVVPEPKFALLVTALLVEALVVEALPAGLETFEMAMVFVTVTVPETLTVVAMSASLHEPVALELGALAVLEDLDGSQSPHVLEVAASVLELLLLDGSH